MLTEAEEVEYLDLLQAEMEYETAVRWERGDLTYKLHPVQRLIYDAVYNLPPPTPDEQRDVVLLCARRFGKSFLVVVMAVQDCLRNPGCIVRIIGPELEQTLEIVEPNLEKVGRDAPRGFIRKQGTRRRWRIGDSQLMIGAFDTKNVKKNLGKEALNIYTEEAGNAVSEQFDYGIREVLSPQILHSKGRIIHATTPPPELDHVFAKEYIPRAKLAGRLFEFTIHDNPLLDKAQLQQAIDDSRGEDTIAFKRNYLVQLLKDPRIVVLPSFDSKRHVTDVLMPRFANWLLFGDWGGTDDCTWLGVGYYDFEAARLVVVDEAWFEPNTSSDVVVPEIARLLRCVRESDRLRMALEMDDWFPMFLDAPGQLRVDLAKMHKIQTAPPGKDDFAAAVNALEVAFRQNRIRVAPKCIHLTAACEFGRFNKRRNDFMRTEALGHCDAIAGLMYGWRMCDKVTNPFPKDLYNRDHYVVPQEENELTLGGLFKRF